MKPLLKTILISSVLFFSLVYLGMKYHWIGFHRNQDNIELKIPENTQTLGEEQPKGVLQSKDLTEAEGDFEPQIIQPIQSVSLVDKMSKEQVTEACTQLLRKSVVDVDLLALAIGDCVISNYRDSIIIVDNAPTQSTKSRQAQIRKAHILNTCQQSLNMENASNEVEIQLLLGICISSKTQ